MGTKCILCGGESNLLEKVSKEFLRNLYLERFSLDIDRLIPDDLYYHSCKECSLRFFTNL